MNMKSYGKAWVILGAVIGTLTTHEVKTETLDCTAITTLPYTVNISGVYCLTGNLSTSMTVGNAITIAANNVTIDLNGWHLGGRTSGLGTQAFGIYAHQQNNITIKNGTVRGFFMASTLVEFLPIPHPRAM